MMHLPKLHKWFCSAEKGVGRAIDKKHLQMKSPEPLVQNQNNFTEVVLMLLSTKIDQKVQLGQRERSGSVVECLTRDQRAAGSSLTGVTVLCP